MNNTWYDGLVDVAHGLGEPHTFVSLVYALDVFCDFIFFLVVCYMFFSNNDGNSGGVSYEGSKYKSSLFNVYDLLYGLIR